MTYTYHQYTRKSPLGTAHAISRYFQSLIKYAAPARITSPRAKKYCIIIPAHILLDGPTNSNPEIETQF